MNHFLFPFRGEAFCHCIMFVFPEDTKNTPTQLFSENECFESNVEEDIPISTITGKCALLNLRDYQSCKFHYEISRAYSRIA